MQKRFPFHLVHAFSWVKRRWSILRAGITKWAMHHWGSVRNKRSQIIWNPQPFSTLETCRLIPKTTIKNNHHVTKVFRVIAITNITTKDKFYIRYQFQKRSLETHAGLDRNRSYKLTSTFTYAVVVILSARWPKSSVHRVSFTSLSNGDTHI